MDATPRSGRRIFVTIMIVLAALLTPLAVTAVWLDATILNQDRFVDTMAPLASDPAVQDLVAERVSTELLKVVDRRETTPPAAEIIPGLGDVLKPMGEVLDSAVVEGVNVLVHSPYFESLWRTSIRSSHKVVVDLIKGDNKYGSIENGEVTVDLSAVGVTALNRLPNVSANGDPTTPGMRLTLFKSGALTHVRTALNALDTLSWFLPLVTILLLAGAVAMSTRRLRALMWCGVGLAAGVTLLKALLGAGRSAYIDAISGLESFPPGGSVFDTLVRYLVGMSRVLFLVAVVVAVAAFVADRMRSSGAEPRRSGSIESWLDRNAGVPRAAVLVLGALVIMLWSPPGLLLVLAVVVAVAVAVALVEVAVLVARS